MAIYTCPECSPDVWYDVKAGEQPPTCRTCGTDVVQGARRDGEPRSVETLERLLAESQERERALQARLDAAAEW